MTGVGTKLGVVPRVLLLAALCALGAGCIEFASDEMICAEDPRPLGCDPAAGDAGADEDAGSVGDAGGTDDAGTNSDAGTNDAGEFPDAGPPSVIRSAHFQEATGAWSDAQARIGETSLALIVTGENLAASTRLQLLSSLDGGVIESWTVDSVATTDAGEVIQIDGVTIPWRATIGAARVQLQSGQDVLVTSAALLIIEPVTVSATGNDSARGTKHAPLATLDRALTLTQSGGTISLLPGQHFYTGDSMSVVPRMATGVTLFGASPTQSSIVGDGGLWTDDGGMSGRPVEVAGLHLAQGARVQNLGMSGHRYGINASGWTVDATLENVRINAHAPISVAGGTALRLDEVVADATTEAALSVGGSARAFATRSTFRSSASRPTVQLEGNARLALQSSEVIGSPQHYVALQAVNMIQGELLLHDSRVAGPGTGVSFLVASPSARFESVDSGVVGAGTYFAVETGGLTVIEASTLTASDAPALSARTGSVVSINEGVRPTALRAAGSVPCILAQSGAQVTIDDTTTCEAATYPNACTETKFYSGPAANCSVQ